MKPKQLVLLCVCNFIVYLVVNGLYALIPVYAIRLGADPGAMGSYLSISFLGIALGNVAGGRLADKFQRRKLQIASGGVLLAGSVMTMRAAVDFTGLVVTTMLTWFLAGLIMSAIITLSGLFAAEGQRGRVFGTLATCVPLALIVAGVSTGRSVVEFGYSGMFLTLAAVAFLLPFAALFLDDRPVAHAEKVQAESSPLWQGRAFRLLIAGYFAACIVNSLPGLVRPLLMNRLEFDEAAITSALTVAGLVALPLPFVMGRLSDRLGRKWLLIYSYTANAVGLALYLPAVTLGQFWLAVAAHSMIHASGGVGPALVADVVPRAALGRALTIYGSVSWFGYVIGLFVMGQAVRQFGTTLSILGGLGLGIGSVLLAYFATRPAHPQPIEVVNPA